MSDPMRPAGETDAIRATARLPGLEIEIVHRVSPKRDAEQITINMQAMPSFEAFGHWLEAANPFAFWMQAAQLFWSPWLGMANAGLLPGVGARQITPRGADAPPDARSSRRD